MPLFGFTIFLGAFLLFQVQPLVARHILPWYGGGPGVWTACMLFFQVSLLIGYAYAHVVSARLTVRRQVIVHAGLLALALPLLSVSPDPSWKPTGGESPTLGILLLLGANIGFPFAVLSATSPLLTRWFSCRWPERNPYRLYALSNAGSLLALLSYPMVLEPNLLLGTQATLWQAGFAVFVLLCAASAWSSRNAMAPEHAGEDHEEGSPPDALWLWIALAAVGSVLLIATTSRISEDIAVTPFLWVVPLAIYLASFIVAFDHERWYLRRVFYPLFGLSAVVLAGALAWDPDWLTYDALLGLYLIVLFAGTMVCHGELVRAKPPSSRLTRFYLAISAGGALGGIFVGLVAPRIFPDYFEYPIGLLATGILAVYCLQRQAARRLVWQWCVGGLVLVMIGGGFARRMFVVMEGSIETSRTFFGVIRIKPGRTSVGTTRFMQHGVIDHGTQFVREELRQIPTGYYGRLSGVGLAIEQYREQVTPAGRGLKIGIVGLGTGTLCAYGQANDTIRMYEIDSEVERLARRHFTYLDDCKAKVEVAIGDARVVLERELAVEPQEFDILVLDAFSGDAVPVHLLTREALTLYRAHMRPGGVIAIHASNQHLAVPAIARGAMESIGLLTRRVTDTGDSRYDGAASDWILASDRTELLYARDILVAATPWNALDRDPIVWTDDYSSLWTARELGQEPGKWARAPNGGRFVADYAQAVKYEDRVSIETICRRVHSDSDAEMSLALLTLRSVKAGLGNEDPLELAGSGVYATMKLGLGAHNLGMLVVIDMGEKRVNLQLGPDWPVQLRAPLQRILESTVSKGIRRGDPSESLRRGFEQIEELIRESMSAAAADE